MARAWHVDLLDAGERDRRSRLRRDADRDRFTVGCALLRTLVGAFTGVSPAAVLLDRTCPDCDQPHGKPVPRNAGTLECSVSHSGDRVVVAVSERAAIGVDVEVVAAKIDDGLAERVLRPSELTALTSLPAADRARGFATYWTRKEAILKATGDGLRIAPELFGVSAPLEPPTVLEVDAEANLPRAVSLHTLTPGTGHVAALAVIGGPPSALVELNATALLSAPRTIEPSRS
jgi:4'-phosphopantetheinyl transferase